MLIPSHDVRVGSNPHVGSNLSLKEQALPKTKQPGSSLFEVSLVLVSLLNN